MSYVQTQCLGSIDINKPLILYSKYSAWFLQADWWIPVQAFEGFNTSTEKTTKKQQHCINTLVQLLQNWVLCVKIWQYFGQNKKLWPELSLQMLLLLTWIYFEWNTKIVTGYISCVIAIHMLLLSTTLHTYQIYIVRFLIQSYLIEWLISALFYRNVIDIKNWIFYCTQIKWRHCQNPVSYVSCFWFIKDSVHSSWATSTSHWETQKVTMVRMVKTEEQFWGDDDKANMYFRNCTECSFMRDALCFFKG